VGAVGALIVSSSGVVEQGGVVLGPGFAAAPAFTDRLASDPGYGDLLRVAHECSAVSSGCLLFNRADYLAAGGMDPVQFPIRFPDIDLCLKLRARGKRIIFSPHAKFKRQSPQGGAGLRDAFYERELRILRAKWGASLAADPYYNPTLSLGPIPYSGLAWPARSLQPRANLPPIANDVLPGF
jgi:GT2 family glycosyltransferase